MSIAEKILVRPAFAHGEEIRGMYDLQKLLKDIWGNYGSQTPEEFDLRIANSNGSIFTAELDFRPAGIAEGIRIYTGGDPEQIPDTFEGLTAHDWSTYNDRGDTVVLVDLTIFPGYEGRGLATAMIRHAQDYSKLIGARHLNTYSPESAIGLHEKHGAEHVRTIPCGRPGLILKGRLSEAVAVMSYRL